MKKLLPLIMLFFAGTALAQNSIEARIAKQSEPKEFELKYDKFKDQSTVQTRVGFRLRKAKIDVVKLYITGKLAGEDPKQVDNFLFQFVPVFSRDWQFLRQHHLIFMVDGVSIDCGDGRHDGEVRTGGVTEWVNFAISRDILERLAKASVVEVQLGTFEGTLSDKGPSRLKGMLEVTQ